MFICQWLMSIPERILDVSRAVLTYPVRYFEQSYCSDGLAWWEVMGSIFDGAVFRGFACATSIRS